MSARGVLVNGSFFLGATGGWAGLLLQYYDRAYGICERLTIKSRQSVR